MTTKPTPDGTSESGSHPSLDNAPTLAPRGHADATDRQNLADTLTVPLPPEQRASPRRPPEDLATPPTASQNPQGAHDPMQPATHPATPHSAEPRTDGDGWFLATGQPAARLQSEGSLPAPARPTSALPAIIGGTVGLMLTVVVIGYLLFG